MKRRTQAALFFGAAAGAMSLGVAFTGTADANIPEYHAVCGHFYGAFNYYPEGTTFAATYSAGVALSTTGTHASFDVHPDMTKPYDWHVVVASPEGTGNVNASGHVNACQLPPTTIPTTVPVSTTPVPTTVPPTTTTICTLPDAYQTPCSAAPRTTIPVTTVPPPVSTTEAPVSPTTGSPPASDAVKVARSTSPPSTVATGQLPETGTDNTPLLVLVAFCLFVGPLLVIITRRRAS